MSEDRVMILDASGDQGERDSGGGIYELLGMQPPEEGGVQKVLVELLSPASPWGSPLRLRDEWAPFDPSEYARRRGGGRYRFRIRRPDGKWGQQVEVTLDGPTHWEAKFRKYYEDHETGEVKRVADAAPAAPGIGGLETLLTMQAKQQELMMTVVTTMMTGQLEAMKAQVQGSKAADPVEAAAGVFGLVAKVRELTGDAPAGKEGWASFLEGLAPAAERFGDALGRSLGEAETRPDGDGDRKSSKSSSASSSQSKQIEGGGEPSAPSQADHMEVLRLVRRSYKKNGPALLAAEVLEVTHPAIAELIVEQGEEGLEALADQLGKYAPEFRDGVGRRWIELVGLCLILEAAGDELPEEACIAVGELEKLVEAEEDQEASSTEPAGPQPVAPATQP